MTEWILVNNTVMYFLQIWLILDTSANIFTFENTCDGYSRAVGDKFR